MTRRVFRRSGALVSWAFAVFLAGCDEYKALDGASCTQASQCASNFCIDGFCCDSACAGTCRSCSAAVKGDGANGTCGPIAANTDPDNECAAGVCSGSGTCILDNGGVCVLSADCLSQHCIDGVCCDAQCDQSCYACSAVEKGNGVDGICGPVTANMDPNNECVSGNCDGAGVCANLAPNGTMCTMASECASNFCVDGFCCNQDCAESCNACNATGLEGTCISTCTPPACTGTIGLPDPPIAGLPATGSSVRAAVDLNGDGYIDIVSASIDAISVFLATGHNTFAPSVDYPSANFPRSGLAADLNGDNRPDLALASYGGNYVSVHINNGDGTFAPNVVYTVGSRSQSIAAADVNGDGQTDLVTANSDVATLSVLMNSGNGTFAPKVDYPTNTEPRAVAIADFNGDGHLDLVTANVGGQYPNGTVSVLLGNGNGTFAPRVDYSSTKPEAMVAADLTGDGKPDVAVLSDTAIAVHQGVGDGSFSERVNYSNNYYYASWLHAADTDQDGDLDLVASTYRSGILTVYTNQNGSFATNTKIPTPGWGGPISVVDVTGDGKRDIIVGGWDDVHVMPNLGNGTFPSDHVPDYGTKMLNPIAVDVNNDGNLDLVAPEDLYVQPSRFKVFMNDGSGHFPIMSTSASHNQKMKFVAASDFNGDGLQDLVTTHYNAVAILLNLGNSTFGPPASVFTNASSIDAMTTGDFNGDGHVDLAYSSFNYTGGPDPARSTVLILLGNGDGTMAPSPVAISWLGSTGTNCHGYGDQLAVADLDNDGKSELVFASCNLDRIEVLKLTTDTLLESYGTAPVVYPLSVHLGDLDGDGLSDLVVGTATGASVLLRQSAFSFAAPVAYDRDGQIDFYALGTVALGDLNNDGNLDLVTPNRWNSLSVYFNQGNAVFAQPVDYSVGWNPRGAISGDWNGDGRDDLAFSADGKIGVALSKCLP